MAFDRRSERVNPIVGWTMIGVIALGAAESFLTDAILWGLFSLLLASVASLPALTTGDWTAMIPWLILFVAAVAVIARAVELYSEIAGFLAIATLALTIVVELEAFTSVELSRWVAVLFAVLTTLAIQSPYSVPVERYRESRIASASSLVRASTNGKWNFYCRLSDGHTGVQGHPLWQSNLFDTAENPATDSGRSRGR